MSDPISSSTPPDSDVASVVAMALERASKPLSIPQLRTALTGPYKVSKERLNAVLQTLQADGKAFAWGTAKTPAYWNRDAMALCRAAILDAVKHGPVLESELKKAAAKAGPGIAPRFSSIFNALIAEEIIFAHPPAKKRGRVTYAAEPFKPPSLDDQIVAKLKSKRLAIPALLEAMKTPFPEATAAEISDALARLEKAERAFRHPPAKKGGGCVWGLERPAFEKELAPLAALEKSRAALLEQGFRLETIDAAIRAKLPKSLAAAASMPDDLSDRVMLIVHATRQPILSLPDVRLLMNVPKAEFDAAVLKLREAGRARLHGHDHPFGIDKHKRDELVSENGERFYVGISPVDD